MLKTPIKRLVSALLLFALALTLVSCMTPGGRHYTSSEKDAKKAATLLAQAQTKTDKIKNGIYDYSFFVTLDVDKTKLKMGTQNVITFTDRGTENVRIHRKNSFSSTQGGVAVSTVNEDHYLIGGMLHTTRYGANFKSASNEQGFYEYTETSEISVNRDYLDISNFKTVEIYDCSGGATEIYCTGANDKLKNGIYAFIGFTEDSGYVYNAKDIELTAVIDDNGTISEKALTFKVDYHPQYYPDQRLTYDGYFSYKVTSSSKVKVSTPETGVKYAGISDINLLNAVTADGYKVLSSFTSLDATYDEFIQVSDTAGQTLIYDVDVHFTENLVGDKLYYGSIDNKTIIGKNSSLNTSTGIFNDDVGYHKRVYDKDTKETDSEDKVKSDETNENMLAVVANTFSTHMMLESDIANFKIQSDSDTEITFYMRFSSDAAKYYTVALMSVFAESNSEITDPDAFPSIAFRENDIYITVRKSDGCIIRHSTKFKAIIASSIEVKGEYSMRVNSTDSNIKILNLTDFNNAISAQ